jgi:hypothetical protein
MVNTVRLASASANLNIMGEAGPHGRVKSTSNLIILLKARAAAQNFGQPKLPNGTLHVANLSLGRGGSFDPLRRLTANTANHVSMRQSLWSALLRLHVEG